ncbi:hypothetical protein ACWEQA_06025 [Nocardia sp. NPDC004085]
MRGLVPITSSAWSALADHAVAVLPCQRQTRSARRGNRLIVQQSLDRRCGERHTVGASAAFDGDHFSFVVELDSPAEHVVEDIIVDDDYRQDCCRQGQRIDPEARIWARSLPSVWAALSR